MNRLRTIHYFDHAFTTLVRKYKIDKSIGHNHYYSMHLCWVVDGKTESYRHHHRHLHRLHNVTSNNNHS